MTAEELARVAHIPNTEIEQDIADTRREIREYQRKISDAEASIAQREQFIAKLETILAARAYDPESKG